jgi:hypothetical protein
MDIKTETRREFGPEIPESVKNFFAGQEERFSKPVTVSFDTERIQKLSKAGMAKEDAESIAFLLWRSRLVHRSAKVSWADAVEHGWLRTELFKVCAERRKQRIAENEARHQRLQSVILTGADSSVDSESPSA